MPVCAKCQQHFPNWIKIDGSTKNISKRKYCLECSPYGLHNTIKLEGRKYLCSRCGETDSSKFSKGRFTECKKCRSKYNETKLLQNKQKSVEYLGGKCVCCRYNKYPCSLDFHHVDPTQKDKNFSTKLHWSWERLKEELKKCVLLCSNCHRAFHSGYITEDDFKYKPD